MNEMQGVAAEPPESSFGFEGSWREYLPIAFTNLLLMIVTLGIYRFWATGRTRRYLWSRTRFIDDRLEWTGTGTEMFLGFLIAFAVIVPALILIQLAMQALVLRQNFAAAGLLALFFYGAIFYLIGVAMFRALRYRLSRTWWHGIRGGSDQGGWRFGVNYLWKMAAGWLAATLLVPWAMIELWNERWGKMSFGQYRFEARAEIGNLILRWLCIFLVPIGFILLLVIAGAAFFALNGGAPPSPGEVPTAVGIFLGLLLLYVSFLLATLSYYAAFYRQAVSATSWAGLHFSFNARSRDWLKLILGNIALVIATLGIGLLFLPYRNWSFAIRHLGASGHLDLEALVQSNVTAPRDAEGLADAFDIGAI